MGVYRTKTFMVQAARLDSQESCEEIAEMLRGCGVSVFSSGSDITLYIQIEGKRGDITQASTGDWVVKVDNEFVVKSDTAFKKLYEEVRDDRVQR